jgi:predicted nucleotide-binding protein
MARPRGIPNRNFPAMSLAKALELPRTLQEGASGMRTDRLTLSQLLDKSPSSSAFVKLVLASRAYGLTTGGKNADEFGLTEIGRLAVSEDPALSGDGLRRAVQSIDPFRAFLSAYDKKKVPQTAAFKAFLVQQAGVPPEHAEEAMTHLIADAKLAGLLRVVKGSEYVDLQASGVIHHPLVKDDEGEEAEEEREEEGLDDSTVDLIPAPRGDETAALPPPPKRPSAIFVGHGKNKKPLEQLTRILDEYKIPYKVAVDEPNRGRPISQKVAEVMDQCGAAILVFTADQQFHDSDGNAVWRPSENVVYELGAAAVKYGRRIIIFKEEAVDFPTNFRDIGHISFAKDQLDSRGMELFRELIDFGLVTFSVPSE